jgi:hypothetical protein
VREPVQRVVDVENRVAVAVRLVHQVADAVIKISLGESRREGGLGDAAESVVGERRDVPGRIGVRPLFSTKAIIRIIPLTKGMLGVKIDPQ